LLAAEILGVHIDLCVVDLDRAVGNVVVARNAV
jgi:hypothetical protein